MASTALRRMVAALAHPYQTIVARNVTQRTCHSIAATAASRSEGSATAWQSGGRRGGGSSGGGAAMAAAAALFGSAMVIGSQSAQCDITEYGHSASPRACLPCGAHAATTMHPLTSFHLHLDSSVLQNRGASGR